MTSILLRILLALVLLVPATTPALVPGGEYRSPEEQRAVEAAEEAYDHREYDVALALAEHAVNAFPHSLEAHRALCLAAAAVGRLSEVMAAHDPTRAGDDEARVVAHYVRAWGAILSGDFQRASEEARRGLDLSPHPRFELRRVDLVGRRQSMGANHSALRSEYRRLVDDYPTIPGAWVSYLNFFNFHGRGTRDHERAVADAIRLAPSAEAFAAAASIEDNRFWGDPAVILEIIEDGLELFPRVTTLGTWQTKILRQLGRMEEALAATRYWRSVAPNHGDFIHEEIAILQELTLWDEALAACDALAGVRYQPGVVEIAGFRRAQILHAANRREEAIKTLRVYLGEHPNAPHARAAALMLSRLVAAGENERVVQLPHIGVLKQRGNYCGPATMSVMLRANGLTKSQEEIARRVYTGIAGTPPQVLHHFAASLGLESLEFEGRPEIWKRLLDAGYPILWLQMLGSRGAHYRIVVGYDDILGNWIVQDPNDHGRRMMPYDRVADFKPFPDMRRSFVIINESRAAAPELAGLRPTARLTITNWIMYISTGSNLFVGLFPAVFVNVACAWAIAWIVLLLLQVQTFPRQGLLPRYFLLAIVGLIAPVNLLIGIFRWGNAVSLLLSLHLALLSLIPILAASAVIRPLLRDYFHPREMIGLCLLVLMTWLCLSVVDQDPWQWALPLGIFALGMPVILLPRLRLRLAEWRAVRGDSIEALAIFSRYGSGAPIPWLRALLMERDAMLNLGRFGELINAGSGVRAALQVGRHAGRGSTYLQDAPARAERRLVLEEELCRHLIGEPVDEQRLEQLARDKSRAEGVLAEALLTATTGREITLAGIETQLEAAACQAFRRGPLRGTTLAELIMIALARRAADLHRASGSVERAREIEERWLAPIRVRSGLIANQLGNG